MPQPLSVPTRLDSLLYLLKLLLYLLELPLPLLNQLTVVLRPVHNSISLVMVATSNLVGLWYLSSAVLQSLQQSRLCLQISLREQYVL